MKILIVNQHTLNFGDDAAGVALIQNLLQYKNLEKIDLFYNTAGQLPIKNQKVYHNPEIMLKKIGYMYLIKYFLLRGLGVKKYNEYLEKMLQIIHEADYIFVSPCGANIGIYKDWRFLVKLLIIRKEKKIPIFYLNTIGKSGSFLFDFFAKKVLACSKIYVREKASLQYVQSLGYKAEFGSDTAFSLIPVESTQKVEGDYIGFIPTMLKNWHPNFKNIDITKRFYQEILPTVAHFARNQGLLVKLIPHLNSTDEKLFYDTVQSELEKMGVLVVQAKKVYTVFGYYQEIAHAKYIIGMRYHSIVLSIKSGVPFLSLSYENKMQEVCDYANMSSFSLKLYTKEFDTKRMDEIFSNMVQYEQKIKRDLKKIVDEKLCEQAKIPLKEIKGDL